MRGNHAHILQVRVKRSRNASASTASDNTSADEGECSNANNSSNANANATAANTSTAEVELSSEAATESVLQKCQKDAHQRPQRGEFTTSEATATPTIPAGSRLIRPRLLVSPSSARCVSSFIYIL